MKQSKCYVFKLFRSILVAFICFSLYNGDVRSQPVSYSLDTGNFARLKYERLFFQPAMLSYISQVRIDAFYSRPFGIKELETRSVMVIYPFNNHRLVFSYGSTGGKLFSENELSLMHVVPITSNIFISTDFGWFNLNIAGYNHMSDFSLTEGVYYLRNNFNVGIRFINLSSGGNANSSRGSRRSVQYSLGHRLTERVTSNLSVLSESGYPATWAMSTILRLYTNFSFLMEAGEKPSVYSLGAEFQRSSYRFTYHLKLHQDLGSTSQLGVSYLIAR